MKKLILSALIALTLPACLGSTVRTLRKANDQLGSISEPALHETQTACDASKEDLKEAGDVLGLQKAIDACNSMLPELQRVAELRKQADEALASKDVERAAKLLDEALGLWQSRQRQR